MLEAISKVSSFLSSQTPRCYEKITIYVSEKSTSKSGPKKPPIKHQDSRTSAGIPSMPGSFIVKNTDESRDSLFKPVKTISSRIEANYKGIV